MAVDEENAPLGTIDINSTGSVSTFGQSLIHGQSNRKSDVAPATSFASECVADGDAQRMSGDSIDESLQKQLATQAEQIRQLSATIAGLQGKQPSNQKQLYTFSLSTNKDSLPCVEIPGAVSTDTAPVD